MGLTNLRRRKPRPFDWELDVEVFTGELGSYPFTSTMPLRAWARVAELVADDPVVADVRAALRMAPCIATDTDPTRAEGVQRTLHSVRGAS